MKPMKWPPGNSYVKIQVHWLLPSLLQFAVFKIAKRLGKANGFENLNQLSPSHFAVCAFRYAKRLGKSQWI